jgi:hypothetical protein
MWGEEGELRVEPEETRDWHEYVQLTQEILAQLPGAGVACS